MGTAISMLERKSTAPEINAVEWQLRVDLAAVHRLANRFGWDDSIYNHFSCALPGNADRFLVKAHGLLMSEITASNLIVVDQDGNTVAGAGTVELSALHIHAAIHKGNPEAVCILHVHPPYSTWLTSIKDNRLKMVNQNSCRFYNNIAYDDHYGGLAVAREEGKRMRAALGNKRVMLHANHGVTVLGSTIEGAFYDLYYLEVVCKEYFLVVSSGQAPRLIPDETARLSSEQIADEWEEGADLTLKAWKRTLDRECSDYAT